jgi:hypothetical protein
MPMSRSENLPNSRKLLPYSALALTFAAIGLLAGCDSDKSTGKQANEFIQGGTTQMKEDVKPVKGFLPKPELLTPGAKGQTALVYRDPAVDFKKYNAVMLDPVTIWAGPTSELQKVPKDQRLDLVNTFHSDMYNALIARCKVVSKPAAGTLRLKFAIADEQSPDATANTVATYAPYVGAVYGVASRAFNQGAGYFAGTATIEGYATDGKTGALIWQGVDKRGGTTAVVENTLDTWLDVHRAFQDWADALVAKLQKAGVCQPSPS